MATRVVPLDELAKELDLFVHAALEQAIGAVIKACIDSIPELVEASPVDTGLYAQSWGVEHDENSVTIGNSAPHAPIIEYGARPFTPPLAPLLAWAKRVLQDPSQPPDYSPAVQALARYTQKKIAAEGMAPRHILENALPRILERIEQELGKLV